MANVRRRAYLSIYLSIYVSMSVPRGGLTPPPLSLTQMTGAGKADAPLAPDGSPVKHKWSELVGKWV